MSFPDLAPRRALGGVVAVWIAAVVLATVIGVLAPAETRPAWLAVGLGVAIVLAFAVQLAYGRSHGFIARVAAATLGSLLAMGFVSLGFALATLVG